MDSGRAELPDSDLRPTGRKSWKTRREGGELDRQVLMAQRAIIELRKILAAKPKVAKGHSLLLRVDQSLRQ